MRKTFHDINGFPNWVIDNIISEVKSKQNQDNAQNSQTVNDQESDSKTVFMTLPYKGDKGVKLVQKLKRTAKKFLPPNIKPVFAFKSKKLASHFKIKDNTNTKHKHDLVYKIKCPQEHCLHSYIGEIARRLEERNAF